MDMVIECWRPLALISTAVTVTAGRPQDFAVGFRGLWAEGFEHRAAGADAPALPLCLWREWSIQSSERRQSSCYRQCR